MDFCASTHEVQDQYGETNLEADSYNSDESSVSDGDNDPNMTSSGSETDDDYCNDISDSNMYEITDCGHETADRQLGKEKEFDLYNYSEDGDIDDFEHFKEKVIVRYKALENMMEEALKKSMEIKEEKIHALESRLEESKSRNLKLQDEVRIMKRECESLKQRYEEESHGRESERRESSVLLRSAQPFLRGQQQNPTKDILELKDHLVRVERTNATMLAENKNMKAQTNALNEQIKKLEQQNSNLQSRNSTLQTQSSSLQTQNAKLQVENSTLQSHCSTLDSQISSLQSHLNQLESEHQHLIHTHEQLQSSHEQLVQDHEELQSIHEQLTSEYEALISEHGSLKSIHKAVKSENRELHGQLTRSVQGKDNMNQLQDELKSMRNLPGENAALREDNERITGQYDKLRGDYRDLLSDHKRIKSEYNQAQLKNTDLQGQCGEYKDQLHAMELEINGLGHKYDTLYQVNQKMEEDNNNLLMQIQALLNTNQELLTKILSSKEQFNEEEKSYLEKMNDLKRQKERLEEKIMEHYKRQDVHKKNRGLGARIARKAAKIFVSKNPRSKSRTNLADTSIDNTSLGSGSQGDTTDGDTSRKSGRPASLWNLTDEPSLTKQNTSLAKSTNALNLDKTNDGFSFSSRGTKSSEDLLADSTNREKESFSSSNSTNLLPGLGQPAHLGDEEDDGGFGTSFSKQPNEMLTWEEFLNEANKVSPKSGKSSENRSQDDTESKSSENSDSGAKRNNLKKRQAPPPPQQLLNTQSGSNPRMSSSIPDVAAVSSHLDISRMSRVSAGSSGSGHDSRPDEHSTPPHSNKTHPETSTPAVSSGSNIKLNHGSFEELNQCSPLLSSTHSDLYRRHTASSTPPSASRTLQYSFADSPQNQSVRSPHQARELPPTPGHSDQLPASDRLDRLMAGSAPNHVSSSPQEIKYDYSVRSGSDHNSQHVSDKPPPSRSLHSQGPHMVSRNFGNKIHSPGNQYRPQNSLSSTHNGPEQGSQNNLNYERPNKNSFRSPASGDVNNSNIRRLSMHETSSQQNIYSSIDDTRSRSYDSPQMNNSVMNGPTRNPSNNQENHYARIRKIERPKSVPPNIFHQQQQQQSPQKNTENSSAYHPPQKIPPVPPPRKNREPMVGRLLREPSQGRQILASRSSSNYQSPSNNTSQIPQSGSIRSQTPTARIGPPAKPVNNTPPAPKVLNNEPKDPKENSTWGAR